MRHYNFETGYLQLFHKLMQKRCDLLMDISVIIIVIIIVVNIIIIIIADVNITYHRNRFSREVNSSLSPFFSGSTHSIRPGRQTFTSIPSAPISSVISFRLTGRQ